MPLTGQGDGQQAAQLVEPEEHLHCGDRVRPLPNVLLMATLLHCNAHLLLQRQDWHARLALRTALRAGELVHQRGDTAVWREGQPCPFIVRQTCYNLV